MTDATTPDVRIHDAQDTERPGAAVAPVGFSLSTRVLITLAAATLTVAGMYFAKDIIGPIVLAVVLVIIAHPVRPLLEKRGWPRWLATTTVIVVVYLILIIILGLLVLALAQFARLVTDSADQFEASARQFTDWVNGLGLSAAQTKAISGSFDPGTLVGIVLAGAKSLLSSISAIALVFAYALFMAADAAYIAPLFARYRDSRGHVIAALNRFASGVRSYMIVNAIFGAIVAVLDGLILWALGVPGAFIWAVLAFITNFIPNIGFIIGVVPPAALALVTGGWGLALVVIGVYIVINVTLQVLVQPRFVAVAVSLGFTITFASVFFWGFVLGPLGALLAVPLTLLLKLLLLDADPQAEWARALSGDRKPEEEQPESRSDHEESAPPASHPAA
ncbi:AI-2E family transporter [Glaciibacter flavus]|uniref:AI-2E family transporter n=1 Tax=Orlajensenia flava TaxID=2565934 RepID=A0A4S4FZ84_9MICO|nr:AI-2E family transporter [Glaciibacter flavus]THG36163.1 AI-2E family transporter [Glaciibacter flavus]